MLCTLCQQTTSNAIRDGENQFCCAGCHAVFNILSTKNQLTNYRDHPIFLQAVRVGLISNPALLEEIARNHASAPEHEWEKIYLEIDDLWCPSCAEVIKLMLLREKGVRHCVVDYATDLAAIEYAPRHIAKETIIETIRALGYTPRAWQEAERKEVQFNLYLRFVIAAFCSVNVMMLAYPLYASYFNFDNQGYGDLFAWLSLVLSLPVVTYCSFPIIRRAWTGFQIGVLGMETLVSIGVGASFVLSVYELARGSTQVYFDSLTVVIAFVLLGKIIESKAKFSAKESLFRLSKAMPKRGRKKFVDGSARFVGVKEIAVQDLLLVCAGEKVILDGVVVEGEGSCDESLMTGEAFPVYKQAGSKVLGGTILQSGCLTFRVTHSLEESALQRIIGMVETNMHSKLPYIRQADVIVAWFVPGVLLVAAMTALLTSWERALAVLLISCPCAIGIAAPLAESYLMQALASIGALVRNRACLALLGKENAYVFDKTGTITKGHFSIVSSLEGLQEQDILKSLALHSTHPICTTLARALDCAPCAPKSIQEYPGKGIKGLFSDLWYMLGSHEFLQENGVISLGTEQTTVAYFASETRVLSMIALQDEVREDAPGLIASLQPARMILLSGDTEASVAAVAKACGFNEFYARRSPQSKKQFIEQLKAQGECIVMVGDGINDAPALAAADISISMVSASDISVHVSDLLLTSDRLGTIAKVRSLAIYGRRILKQNLFWAFVYNVIGIVLAVCGWLTPVFSAFAMTASSIIVLLNARRLRRSR